MQAVPVMAEMHHDEADMQISATKDEDSPAPGLTPQISGQSTVPHKRNPVVPCTCRHCTRRRLAGEKTVEKGHGRHKCIVIDYIKKDPQVRDVLLSEETVFVFQMTLWNT